MGTKVVLVVEDDDDTRESLVEFLRDHQFATVAASDAATALEALRQGLDPLVILLDLMMPGLSGWEFRRLQMNDPGLNKIPVVIMTALAVDSASTKAQLGNVTWLAKPFSLETLVATIAQASRPAGAP
ncbi:MAG TPA: response regulator [Polyangia bacterium]|nr:response regulator [Polyangia bacterium]